MTIDVQGKRTTNRYITALELRENPMKIIKLLRVFSRTASRINFDRMEKYTKAARNYLKSISVKSIEITHHRRKY